MSQFSGYIEGVFIPDESHQTIRYVACAGPAITDPEPPPVSRGHFYMQPTRRPRVVFPPTQTVELADSLG